VDVVVHAAALKHVLICEQNPAEAVKTNILGTQNVVDLAQQNEVKVMMMISTDKAVYPTSTMGAAKYVAEKLTLDGNSVGTTLFACVRFGNVLGSRGSVIPSMVKGVKERGQIWISDEGITRFGMPIPEAARLVLDAIELCKGGEIFVLKMKAFSLGQLVQVMRNMSFAAAGFDVDVRGLIRAEKMHEDLVTVDEMNRLWETETHFVIAPPVGDWVAESNMRKVTLDNYNSSQCDSFSDEELAQHIEDCVVALGLD
jgi:FlaA1/EpsC-like NDP-sugar epimerase